MKQVARRTRGKLIKSPCCNGGLGLLEKRMRLNEFEVDREVSETIFNHNDNKLNSIGMTSETVIC